MNNIEKMAQDSPDVKVFAEKYFDYLHGLLKKIDVSEIKKFIDELEAACFEGNTVFILGNGGSAATASHMANDFGLDRLTGKGSVLKAYSLVDNVSMVTAIANDRGYENIFLHQLQMYYRPGDKLIAISVSGDSVNVVAAAQWVKDRGGVVMSFLGCDESRLAELSNIAITLGVLPGEYGPAEDAHIILEHLISSWMRWRRIYI